MVTETTPGITITTTTETEGTTGITIINKVGGGANLDEATGDPAGRRNRPLCHHPSATLHLSSSCWVAIASRSVIAILIENPSTRAYERRCSLQKIPLLRWRSPGIMALAEFIESARPVLDLQEG